jgi:ureidoacrylate peracid hydrolase
MLNYRTIVVSDGNATASDGAHNAALSALMMQFSDIYNTDETIGLIEAAAAPRKSRVG